MEPEIEAMMVDFLRLPRREKYQFLSMMYFLLANAEAAPNARHET